MLQELCRDRLDLGTTAGTALAGLLARVDALDGPEGTSPSVLLKIFFAFCGKCMTNNEDIYSRILGIGTEATGNRKIFRVLS